MKVSNLTNELTLREAAHQTGYDISHLLRIASRGPEKLELLWSVDYTDIVNVKKWDIPDPFGGDTCGYMAISCMNADELMHKNMTSVSTFLFPISTPPKPGLMDIRMRLGMPGEVKVEGMVTINLEKHLDYIFVTRKSIEELIARDKKKQQSPEKRSRKKKFKKKPMDMLIDSILEDDPNIPAVKAWNNLRKYNELLELDCILDFFPIEIGEDGIAVRADKETVTVSTENPDTFKIYEPLQFRSFEKKLSKHRKRHRN